MKKRLISLSLVTILALCLVFPLSACGKNKEKLTSYDIKAVLDYDNKTVSAEMKVNYINATDGALDEVCFHLYPSAFRKDARFRPVEESMKADAYPNGESYGGITVTQVSVGGQEKSVVIEGEDDDILVVETEEILPGESVEIGIDFALIIPNVRHRFGHYNGIINLGNWYPIACVVEDGKAETSPYYAIGDPFYSECADYKVTLSLPEKYTAVLTGEGEKIGSVYTFSAKKVRDYAIVVGEFEKVSKSINGVTVNYYFVADDNPEKNLNTACDAISTFSSTFGKYPYKNYSVVKTHFLHGGMEYPQIALVSDALSNDMTTEAIVHETAHQWWYGVVGNNEIENSWLDEGLTEYSTSLFFEKNASYGVSYDKRIADALSSYTLYYDTFKNSGANTSMNRRLCDYSSSFEYTFMTYVKGELMFEAIRKAIGDEKFFGGLRRYYDEYKYKIATADALIGCMERSAKTPLKSFFDSFVEGKAQHYGGVQ